MPTRFQIGDEVRVIRNVRDDGTYPGAQMGELLVRRGSVGHVIDVGTFLIDQIIYAVHFLDIGRIVGCREEELIPADEAWAPSRFEFREKVLLRADLPVGENVLAAGSRGEILKVVRDHRNGKVAYHVHFDALPGRLLQLPEGLLDAALP